MAKTGKPNILVIWGDDIGVWNLSCYHRGTMGSRTPNIEPKGRCSPTTTASRAARRAGPLSSPASTRSARGC